MTILSDIVCYVKKIIARIITHNFFFYRHSKSIPSSPQLTFFIKVYPIEVTHHVYINLQVKPTFIAQLWTENTMPVIIKRNIGLHSSASC